ncbi:uncharacterized protein LOC135827761 isoform X2 [Sycon ciliatum]|uniref:uncharacterized protein LOC135827761 isoform X2 n=1 Tax=Sycon ciliatum TaxID=27933 RepID=UPI0031F607F1
MVRLGNIPITLCLLGILQWHEFIVNGAAAQDVAPTTAVNGSENQVDPTSPPPYNCLEQWLILAGASPTEAQAYSTASLVTRFQLDELKISTLGDIVLELLLGFNLRLVNSLKTCVARNATCPADLAPDALPCGVSGTCLHNSTQRRPTCYCEAGLTGQQCQTDVNECIDTPSPCHEHANCSNTIGSFTCVCKSGFHGNGLHCEADICTSSLDSNLCHQAKHLQHQNKQLEKKLDQRDREISRLVFEVHSMATAFRRYHKDTSNTMEAMQSTLDAETDRLRDDLLQTKSDLLQTKSDLLQTQEMVKYNKVRLIDAKAMMDDGLAAIVLETKATLNDTKSMVDTSLVTIANDTRLMLDGTKSDLLSTISTMATKSQLHTTKKHLNMEVDAMRSDLNQIDQHLTNVERKQNTTCGIVAWKTFRQVTGTSAVYPMNVIYNKTRADTVLRIMYTATFGSYHYTWTTFTISILINNTDCQDPGPIRSGVSGYHSGSGSVYTILPGAISGVCNINTAGSLRITTKLADHSGRYKYEGYYRSGSSRITSSLHVEEMCPNSNN